VSDLPPTTRPDAEAPRPADDDAPLELEDTGADSTQMVDADEADESPRRPDAGASAGESGGPSVTTGGFETMLGKLVVESGLVTGEELDRCNQKLEDSLDQSDALRTLGDLLVSEDYVTSRQLDRLRSDFDAKKSSQRIPGYRIQKKVGSGAMATVFLARQLSLDRPVAIKVLPKKFSANTSFIDRFYKEGRAAAKLNHPNIVSAYDVGKAGDHHFFVMEYVDGQTVYDRIVKERRVDEQEALQIVIQVAKALQHAHERGFVHRDIKPKNIMIARNGTVKLADLGLARAISDQEAAKAEAGRAYGTPYYISPEQIRGELHIGPAADIYGLGATLYHMVAGKVPFEGKNPSAVMHKHLKEPLVPPDHVNEQLSDGCAQIIEMMLAKSPKDRYHSATDLLEDLELVAEGQSPHFAHRSLDLSSIAPAGPASEPTVLDLPAVSRITDSPMFMLLLMLLIVSVLVNVVLAILMATG
jgi:serine/threonine-protein kinase